MSRRSYTSTPNLLPLATGDLANNSRTNRLRGLPRPSGTGSATSSSRGIRIPLYIKRIFRPPTLDFETAIWEIFYLVVSPRKVYKSLYYHKQTKNTWARDDPSFVILLSTLLAVSAIAWGLAYSPSILAILKLIVYMVLVDFLATGLIISTVGWLFANRFLKHKNAGSGGVMSIDGDLEWAYCFDVHCNSFLLIWLCLYVIQFLLLPVLNRTNWISLFLGNTLYLIALCYYFVITFLGYSNMPFLEHTELLLFPIPIIAILYFMSLFGFNMVRTMVYLYFG